MQSLCDVFYYWTCFPDLPQVIRPEGLDKLEDGGLVAQGDS